MASPVDVFGDWLSDYYTEAEAYLTQIIAKRIEQDHTIFEDDLARLNTIHELQREATKITGNLAENTAAMTAAIIETASWIATVEVAAQLPRIETTYGHPLGAAHQTAMVRLQADMLSRFSDVRNRILRFPQDVHQEIGAIMVTEKLTGIQGTVDHHRQMLRDWVAKGIPAFVDSAGRRWSNGAYVEMVTRTGVQRALTEGRRDQIMSAGLNFAVIHEVAGACGPCSEWAGKIIAVHAESYPPGRIQVKSMVGDGFVSIHVAGSLNDARTAGWGHPNCRGQIVAYVPGVTNSDRFKADLDLGDYEAEQRLRELERRLRRDKRKLAADPENPRRKAMVLKQQRLIREHVAETGVKRMPNREQVWWAKSDKQFRSFATPVLSTSGVDALFGRKLTEIAGTLPTVIKHGDFRPGVIYRDHKWLASFGDSLKSHELAGVEALEGLGFTGVWLPRPLQTKGAAPAQKGELASCDLWLAQVGLIDIKQLSTPTGSAVYSQLRTGAKQAPAIGFYPGSEVTIDQLEALVREEIERLRKTDPNGRRSASKVTDIIVFDSTELRVIKAKGKVVP